MPTEDSWLHHATSTSTDIVKQSSNDIMTLPQLPDCWREEPKAPESQVTLRGLIKSLCCFKQPAHEEIGRWISYSGSAR